MFFDPAIVATLHLKEKPTKHHDDKRNDGKMARASFFTLASKTKRMKRQNV